MMVIILSTSIFAQSLSTIKDIPDGWQRWLEVGGFADIILVGRHDNTSILGVKINF